MDNQQYAEKIAKENEHIATAEIKEDILDTQSEITTMEREIKGLRLINDKMSNFKADAKGSGIEDRKEFIKNLQMILSVRKESYDKYKPYTRRN